MIRLLIITTILLLTWGAQAQVTVRDIAERNLGTLHGQIENFGIGCSLIIQRTGTRQKTFWFRHGTESNGVFKEAQSEISRNPTECVYSVEAGSRARRCIDDFWHFKGSNLLLINRAPLERYGRITMRAVYEFEPTNLQLRSVFFVDSNYKCVFD